LKTKLKARATVSKSRRDVELQTEDQHYTAGTTTSETKSSLQLTSDSDSATQEILNAKDQTIGGLLQMKMRAWSMMLMIPKMTKIRMPPMTLMFMMRSERACWLRESNGTRKAESL
jgi:hypothetical protein